MPTSKLKKHISVFIASPGDLRSEREQFRKAIDILNIGFGDGANVQFEALGWEDTLATTGRRNQEVINKEIDRCDVFFLVMHRRWGQEAPDAKPYSSYTEEEFFRALHHWEKEKKPEIFVFFKRVEAAQEADPGPQLKKVLDFRKSLEESRKVLYRSIGDTHNAFLDEVDRHLRAYAKGELPEADRPRESVLLPLSVLEEIDLISEEKQMAERALEDRATQQEKIEALQLQMAKDAAKFALDGYLEHAREKFVSLMGDTANLQILNLAEEFFTRTGDLDSSFEVLKRILDRSESNSEEASHAQSRLGNLYLTHGDLEAAEAMYQKSLAINEALAHQEGMANQYGNLGIVHKTRGDLEAAVEMYKKSLAINEVLGRKESMAKDFANLGNVYRIREDLKAAEAMYQKSLTINEALGLKEGMASDFGSLGIVYQGRGHLEMAKKMFQKSLTINEELGRKEGMAIQYGNLGIVYQKRGDLVVSMEMYQKSLAINEALSRKEGMAIQYGNLGNLFETRGDFAVAEAMYQKALAINEVLGRKEGLAIQYVNLGHLHETREDLEAAENLYQKAYSLFKHLGSPKAEEVRCLLDAL